MDPKTQLTNMIEEVKSRLQLPAIENYFPIADRPLAKHSGITITGNFETDDDTTAGRLSYVTVLRDQNSLDPANGYGFAWMKGDGSLFNVYLVDNSPLSNDLFIGNDTVINSNGENTWKAAGKLAIAINTVYNFKLMIGEDYAMSLKIWAASGSEPGSVLIQVGAPTGSTAASGDRFGIGVIGTNNCQWWYDDIIVTSIVGIHTTALFRLKALPSEFPNGTDARVNFYGYGIDGTAPSELFGVTTFIRARVAGVWDWYQIGTNTSTNTTDRNLTKISKDFTISSMYVSDDGFVDMLATTTYATTDVTDLTTYYVSLERPAVSGIHSGGCADIYVNDPTRIVVAEQTVNNITGVIELTEANGFLTPLHSIIDVQVAMIGDSFIRNQDWVLVPGDMSNALSVYESPKIVFSPQLSYYKVKVIYRYYQSGKAMQSLLESAAYRFAGTSNVQKIMPPVIIRFNNLTFRGSISDTALKTLLKKYVLSMTTKIIRSEIINLLYRNGVTYIDLTTLSIGVIDSDYSRTLWDEEELADIYYKTSLTAFYTDEYEMSGIRRQ